MLEDKAHGYESYRTHRLMLGELFTYAIGKGGRRHIEGNPGQALLPQQAVMLVFCMVYVAWLSPVAFVIVVGSIVVTYFLIGNIQKVLSRNFKQLSIEEANLFKNLEHLIAGFKEVKLNMDKSQAIYQQYCEHAQETECLKVDNRKRASWSILMSHLFMYALLGSIVFALPAFVDDGASLVGKLVATVLFIITPLLLILEGIPTIERANSSLERIYQLENTLSISSREQEFPVELATPAFEQLCVENAIFQYYDEAGGSVFQVGPINLLIKKGELIFIIGGNGSGKSTLVKLLCGLYTPEQGSISLNGKPLDINQTALLRAQYSAVFADFHLFETCFGLTDIDAQRVEKLLNEMGLSEKVSFENGRFSTLQLSTGQRKRLALIVALLEDRDIFLFDEWASDQDVHFRDYFYHEILPGLKSVGKTVIVVTHDDRYWSHCDRFLKLELGMVQELSVGDMASHNYMPVINEV